MAVKKNGKQYLVIVFIAILIPFNGHSRQKENTISEKQK
jgi:hypothetical protein